MNSIVRAHDVRKSYGSARVLNGLNLSVDEGSIFALVGANGTGKTTAFKILMNILRPDSGIAEVFGVETTRLGASEFARIGYVSENQETQGWMTVDYLLRYLRPFYPSWDAALVTQLRRQFALPGHRRITDLSHGMRMKALLLSSLAYRPKLLVMDEPFAGLDAIVRDDLICSMIESAHETTILLSSHDLADIETFATHIGYLDGGRLLFSEEMSSLTCRFREIEVLVNSPAMVAPGRPWPETWLRPETGSALVRFVETRFNPERTASSIRAVFEGVENVTVTPMPLKSIFLALARASQSKARNV